MGKDKKKKDNEPDFNPFAITPGRQATPPPSIVNETHIPASLMNQWEVREMVEKAAADSVEQELLKRKTMLGLHQMGELIEYSTTKGQSLIDDTEARIEQAQAQDTTGRQLQKKFLESQLTIYGHHAQHLLDKTMGQLEDIASRPVHVDPEEEPPTEPRKKGFW